MNICELLIWTWETEIMKHDMIWRITMQIEGCVICQGWTINLLLQWQNQNITEIFSLTSTLFSSNSSCHQPSSHSFAILAMFFFFFAKHEDFYFIFSSSTKTAGLMQPCPQSFSIALVFSRDILHLTDIVSLDITNVFKIWSMVSWIWRISQEICAHQNWRNILNKELQRCNTIPC